MSNQLSVFNRRREMSLTEDAAAELGGLMLPRVSTRGDRFALIDAAGVRYPLDTLHMDVVIIDVNPHKSKLFWGLEDFDPNATDRYPPICFSDNGVAPSANSQEPQARTCGECRHNEWGSRINEKTGSRVKACDDRKKMAVIVMNETTGLVYQLQIPPASLKHLVTYSGQLQTFKPPRMERKADLNDVITRITFADGKTGEMRFNAIGWISSVAPGPQGGWGFDVDAKKQLMPASDQGMAFGEAIDDVIDRGVTDDIVGRNDRPWSNSNALPRNDLPWSNSNALPAAAQKPVENKTPNLELERDAKQLQPPPKKELAAPGHGGRRPGSGRKRQPVESPFPQQASAPVSEPIALDIPASGDETLSGPGTDISNVQRELGKDHSPPSNPAFAQPQELGAQLDEALNFALSLKRAD